MEAGARLVLPAAWGERGVYLVDGAAEIDGEALNVGSLAVVADGDAALVATSSSRLMLLGGAPLPEPRHIEWNFVSHDPARIARAARDWREGRFPPVPGETEFIPY